MPDIFVKRVDYSNAEETKKLTDLLNAYARDPLGGGQEIVADILKKLPDALAKTPGALSLIVFYDGTPAGFANCFHGFSTFRAAPLINIHDLSVLPAFRGKKLSYYLLKEIERIAHEGNCCKMTLEVLEKNEPAKKSYSRFGFSAYELDAHYGQAHFWEKIL